MSSDSSESRPAKRPLELTLTVIILSVILAVVMGAANVYLGLKVGMTVSASIPAAVIATGILRGLLNRRSVLESNLVQTAASAGESLAAGIIFTMPAMILIGYWSDFHFWTTSLIALAGGLLGILLMIPMRRVFVVDNKELLYPEGVACAEVLNAGAAEDSNAAAGLWKVITGILLGGIFTFFVKVVHLIRGTVEAATITGGRVLYFGSDMSPALVGVGFIVGLPIAFQVFLGGSIGWLVTIPMLPAPTDAETAVDAAYDLWSTKVRYIGVGTMVIGGLASIYQVRGGLAAAVRELGAILSGKTVVEEKDTERNIGMAAITFWGVLCVVMIGGIYYTMLDRSIPLTLLTTIAMFLLSFFMAAVASYIVGLVGNSNSPVSGMTIMAVLATGSLLYVLGFSGVQGQVAVLVVAGVVCCVACTSGDVCNDLKTGHLVGASPRLQQIMQVVGVCVAAFVMAPVLSVLHQAYEIGSTELPAPQAGLFKSLTEGFFGDQPLPKVMVGIGAAIGVVLLIIDTFLAKSKSTFRLHVMPVAVGIYLPFGIAPPMLLGGLLSWWVLRAKTKQAKANEKIGVLVSSGIIAGESLMGVGAAFLVFGQDRAPNWFGESLPDWGAALAGVAGDTSVDAISVVALLVVLGVLFASTQGGSKVDYADGDES